jgi:hypothetical protein
MPFGNHYRSHKYLGSDYGFCLNWLLFKFKLDSLRYALLNLHRRQNGRACRRMAIHTPCFDPLIAVYIKAAWSCE